MADWTTITDSQVDPKAPVTSELMTALRDNPIAMAQGATNAPRIAEKIQSALGQNEAWATIGNLSSGGGVYVDYHAICSTSSEFGEAGFVQFEISTDGSTFTDTKTIGYAPPSALSVVVSGSLFFDFSSGDYQAVYSGGSVAGRYSATIAGGPFSIQSMRFRATGYSSGSDVAVICRLQGGLSAS